MAWRQHVRAAEDRKKKTTIIAAAAKEPARNPVATAAPKLEERKWWMSIEYGFHSGRIGEAISICICAPLIRADQPFLSQLTLILPLGLLF